jgi:Raf kinase inhibitor-like YbhB/YbcL family protein
MLGELIDSLLPLTEHHAQGWHDHCHLTHMSIASVIGQAIRPLRAGEEKLLYHQLGLDSTKETIQLTSAAFGSDTSMPVRYTTEAADISPPLAWSGCPAETRELVLVMEDFDVPFPSPLTHFIVWHLGQSLEEAALPNREGVGNDASIKLGQNSMGHERYDGPAPPAGHGVHHYVFQIFALDHALSFEEVPKPKDIANELKDHVLAFGILVGTFER